jgi:hypothetical protein
MFGIKPKLMRCRFEVTHFYDLLTYLRTVRECLFLPVTYIYVVFSCACVKGRGFEAISYRLSKGEAKIRVSVVTY